MTTPSAAAHHPPSVPRLAATLVLVRPAAAGFEILLLQRADKGDHNSGAWVFPGGIVDAADGQGDGPCEGLHDAAASARLGLASGGPAFYLAAIRECFEESGVLLAEDEQGRPAATGAALLQLRDPLRRGEIDFAAACREHGLTPTVDRLAYIAHWVTPVGLPKRFDTRFFLAVMPPGQSSAHDAIETVDQVWLPPAQILAPENARRMLKVTRTIVEMLERFADLAALLQWARAPREVPRVMQRRCTDAGGLRTVMPDHPADPADPAHLLGWLLAEEGLLFAGSATITPAELASALRATVRWIAPAHGFLLPAP